MIINDGYCECIEIYDTGVWDLDHENDFELMKQLLNICLLNIPSFVMFIKIYKIHIIEILLL